MDYEKLLEEIKELKQLCRDYEQDIIDDRIVNMTDYRKALKDLFWKKVERDTIDHERRQR